MKILVISESWLWELADHDPFKFRYAKILRDLEEHGHSISKIGYKRAENLTSGFAYKTDEQGIIAASFPPISQRKSAYFLRKFADLIAPHRRLKSDAAMISLIESVDPDLVIFLVGYSPRFVRNLGGVRPSILFAEEDFSLSWVGLTPKSSLAKIRNFLTRPLSRRVLPRPKTVIVISEREREWAEYSYPNSEIESVPIFIDEPYWLAGVHPDSYQPKEIEIFAIGNFFQARNAMGLKAFLNEIQSRHLDLPPKVTLASRDGLHPILQSVSPHLLEFHGSVENPRSYYDRATMCLVPSFHVSGAKNQILQGWARNCPVITTNTAAQTVGGVSGGNLLTGSDAAELVDAVIKMREDAALREQLVKGGHATLLQEFSTDIALAKVRKLIENV